MDDGTMQSDMIEYLRSLDKASTTLVDFQNLGLASIDFLLPELISFPFLRTLDLSGNLLEKLPCLKEISTLDTIILRGNPIVSKPLEHTFTTDILHPLTRVVYDHHPLSSILHSIFDENKALSSLADAFDIMFALLQRIHGQTLDLCTSLFAASPPPQQSDISCQKLIQPEQNYQSSTLTTMLQDKDSDSEGEPIPTQLTQKTASPRPRAPKSSPGRDSPSTHEHSQQFNLLMSPGASSAGNKHSSSLKELSSPQISRKSSTSPFVDKITPSLHSEEQIQTTHKSLQAHRLIANQQEQGMTKISLNPIQFETLVQEIVFFKRRHDKKCQQLSQPIVSLSAYLPIYLNRKFGLKSLVRDYMGALNFHGKGIQAVQLYLRTLETTIGLPVSETVDLEGEDEIKSHTVAVFVSALNGLIDDDFFGVATQLTVTVFLLLRNFISDNVAAKLGETTRTKLARETIPSPALETNIETTLKNKIGERRYDEITTWMSWETDNKRIVKPREGSIYGIGDLTGKGPPQMPELEKGHLTRQEWIYVVNGLYEGSWERQTLIDIVNSEINSANSKQHHYLQSLKSQSKPPPTTISQTLIESLKHKAQLSPVKLPSPRAVSPQTSPVRTLEISPDSIPFSFFLKCVLNFQLFQQISLLQPFRSIFTNVLAALHSNYSRQSQNIPAYALNEDEFILLTNEVLSELMKKKNQQTSETQRIDEIPDEVVINIAQTKLALIPESCRTAITFTQCVNVFTNEIMELASFYESI
ncbi:hypothetical protein BLNAU_12953 [Blattamonas nauphoetae]|uniref:Uncharacterized protein n=1 Tax=Blattamonas nauphoetae TaxID=2049346 RepID=A0ABQ9XI46_9EUKA|nr:hypothetical protein BLNAU_12953 [Blattamonas nauphoetae]